MGRKRTFGEIDGFPPGTTFVNRDEANKAGVHRNPQTGIVGGKDGAESVVLAGGYTDQDDGDVIVYTGEGGRNSNTGKRNGDQELVRGNLGLRRNVDTEMPVRVIRGAKADTPYSPKQGYRYSGLYRVTAAWRDTNEGWLTWRFRLEAFGELRLDERPGALVPVKEINSPVRRIERKYLAQLREAKLAQKVKEIYDFKCQICVTQLVTPAGKYAEAAHIRGLGEPHNGPDELDNLLCLCPNHHVLFDRGAISIRNGRDVIDVATGSQIYTLKIEHEIDIRHLDYHAKHVSYPAESWIHYDANKARSLAQDPAG
ncbi:YDG/SRA domain-containing protein [Stackebrandtia endophytica]|nr:YDG/SRA domain-containing protein [Stackebrandtia endophytica]